MDNCIGGLLESPGVFALNQKVFEVRKEPKDWRSNFLAILGDMYPAKVLWSRESFAGHAFEPIPALPNCWTINSYNDAEKLLNQLYQGGWGMIFGKEDILFAESVPPDYLPTEVEAIEVLLESTGAQALILSWYDDNEWMVAISC